VYLPATGILGEIKKQEARPQPEFQPEYQQYPTDFAGMYPQERICQDQTLHCQNTMTTQCS
jgi:hypothetical protein